MLNVTINPFMLSVVMLNAIMLNVMAPTKKGCHHFCNNTLVDFELKPTLILGIIARSLKILCEHLDV